LAWWWWWWWKKKKRWSGLKKKRSMAVFLFEAIDSPLLTFRFASYSASSCGSLRRCSGCWSSLLTSAKAAARAVKASSGTPTAAGGGGNGDERMAFFFFFVEEAARREGERQFFLSLSLFLDPSVTRPVLFHFTT
jgi:hypothetical protein